MSISVKLRKEIWKSGFLNCALNCNGGPCCHEHVEKAWKDYWEVKKQTLKKPIAKAGKWKVYRIGKKPKKFELPESVKRLSN